jgi:prophage DNA circulation protein
MDFNSTVNNLNQFINNANEVLTCNEECQQQKQSAQLLQNYDNALNNLQTAPSQLQSAQQQYITYTQGAGAYQQTQTTNLQNTASQLAAEYQKKFNEEIKNANTKLYSYSGLVINYSNIVDLSNQYTTENIELHNDIKYSTSDTLTNDRKTYYENQATESLQRYAWFLNLVYIVLVVSYCISAFFVTSYYPFNYRLTVLIILIIYPFISLWLSLKCIEIYNFIINLLPKNQYKSI